MTTSEVNKTSGRKMSPSARRKSRQLAVQALYQWQMAKTSLNDIEAQFRSNNDFTKIDPLYFNELVRSIPAQAGAVDENIAPALDRSIDQLDPVELAILRIGCYELMSRKDVPYRVVINEAIELAKRYGAQDSHRYVNGILDKLAPKLRSEEVKAFRKKS